MLEAEALLARLDAILREVTTLRDQVAASMPPVEGNGLDTAADDFSEDNLIDTTSASARFNYSRDSIARWAREGDGLRRGGRWVISIKRIQKRLARLHV